jgi:hypothetical protein
MADAVAPAPEPSTHGAATQTSLLTVAWFHA